MRKCYANGIVDQHTLFWGNGLGDWVPLRNIRGMATSLSDPKTKFVKFLVDKFAFPVKDRRANRDALYDEGLAKSRSRGAGSRGVGASRVWRAGDGALRRGDHRKSGGGG